MEAWDHYDWLLLATVLQMCMELSPALQLIGRCQGMHHFEKWGICFLEACNPRLLLVDEQMLQGWQI